VDNSRSKPLPGAKDKLLFTPGPLTTSLSVKQAMLHDAGSWDVEFNSVVARVREDLLRLAGITRESGWEAVLLQGSGSFGVEAVFQTCVPTQGKVAVFANGAYGERIVQMLKHARIEHAVLRTAEDIPASPAALETLLSQDQGITHVALVHCETTTGILNPLEEISAVVRKHRKIFVVDAMSSFGALPIDFERCGIDFLISSANKCIEGIPGFSFVFCRRALLLACEGFARSLSLDLLGQLKGFEKNGQFRYTPPTHTILAFEQALCELEQEGGVAARERRYRQNHETLMKGMAGLKIQPYLPSEVQSCIITAFHTPKDPGFSFDVFYRKLSARGFIIYPGKLTQVDTFRIGNIGRIFPSDIEQLVYAIGETMEEIRSSKPEIRASKSEIRNPNAEPRVGVRIHRDRDGAL
jgi:2-aminoethylphosphonate-pyruvate transaminase